MCRVWSFGGIFFHFPDGFWEAMIYKGTMGRWEQTISNRQRALLSEGVSLFPRRLAGLGTGEQKMPIPTLEDPRSCGSTLLPPAGEWR